MSLNLNLNNILTLQYRKIDNKILLLSLLHFWLCNFAWERKLRNRHLLLLYSVSKLNTFFLDCWAKTSLSLLFVISFHPSDNSSNFETINFIIIIIPQSVVLHFSPQIEECLSNSSPLSQIYFPWTNNLFHMELTCPP